MRGGKHPIKRRPGGVCLTDVARNCFRHGASYLYIVPGNKPLVRMGLGEAVAFGGASIQKVHILEFLDQTFIR